MYAAACVIMFPCFQLYSLPPAPLRRPQARLAKSALQYLGSVTEDNRLCPHHPPSQNQPSALDPPTSQYADCAAVPNYGQTSLQAKISTLN
jgi:hypothetical protein